MCLLIDPPLFKCLCHIMIVTPEIFLRFSRNFLAFLHIFLSLFKFYPFFKFFVFPYKSHQPVLFRIFFHKTKTVKIKTAMRHDARRARGPERLPSKRRFFLNYFSTFFTLITTLRRKQPKKTRGGRGKIYKVNDQIFFILLTTKLDQIAQKTVDVRA